MALAEIRNVFEFKREPESITVTELIGKLSILPPDKEVWIGGGEELRCAQSVTVEWDPDINEAFVVVWAGEDEG